ncbi:hypothetical protein [Vannielia litorea]|uniref:hypothetical protein n=1 Tax=Vannielia litorea TaxID=1217970 RepID=UPI001BD0A924|nr:hypothetical protein [Vannielia litorea]MBS8225855.1 hypothetical protein [Vannielia litorea]
MRHVGGPALLWAALATTTQAACPVANDMAAGVRITLESGEAEVFRATSDVLVESLLGKADGAQTRFTYARGVYLLESVDVTAEGLRPDSRATFAFPVRPEEAPLPLPGHGWGVRVVATYAGSPVAEMLGIRFGPQQEVTIGDCRLAMVPVEQRIYEDGEMVAREERHYLPDLGFSYSAAWHEEDRVDRYTPVSIEPVE